MACLINVQLLIGISYVLVNFAIVQAEDFFYCPCAFNATKSINHDNKEYDTCLGLAPLAAGQNFTLEGVKAACKALKATPVVVKEDSKLERAIIKESRAWDNQLYLTVDQSGEQEECTVVSNHDPIKKPCEDFFGGEEPTLVESVMCETKPWVNAKPNCSCPCGFHLDEHYRCVRGMAACEPLANFTIISSLCYSLRPTVAFPARIGEDEQPPEDWPADTVFFVGNFYADMNVEGGPGPKCGYKESYMGGKYLNGTCEYIFNFSDIFAVLCVGYERQYNGTCPKKVRPRCSGPVISPPEIFFLALGFFLLIKYAFAWNVE